VRIRFTFFIPVRSPDAIRQYRLQLRHHPVQPAVLSLPASCGRAPDRPSWGTGGAEVRPGEAPYELFERLQRRYDAIELVGAIRSLSRGETSRSKMTRCAGDRAAASFFTREAAGWILQQELVENWSVPFTGDHDLAVENEA
jgi:hypothetical protein